MIEEETKEAVEVFEAWCEELKDKFHKAKKERGISVDEFFDEIEKRIYKKERNEMIEGKYECENCFLNFYSPEKGKYCDVCSSDDEIKSNPHKRFERQLEVLDRANVNRFPTIVKNMYSLFKELEDKFKEMKP